MPAEGGAGRQLGRQASGCGRNAQVAAVVQMVGEMVADDWWSLRGEQAAQAAGWQQPTRSGGVLLPGCQLTGSKEATQHGDWHGPRWGPATAEAHSSLSEWLCGRRTRVGRGSRWWRQAGGGQVLTSSVNCRPSRKANSAALDNPAHAGPRDQQPKGSASSISGHQYVTLAAQRGNRLGSAQWPNAQVSAYAPV